VAMAGGEFSWGDSRLSGAKGSIPYYSGLVVTPLGRPKVMLK
jgi:hypothetical protein